MITIGATQDYADEENFKGTAGWWLLHYLKEAGFETSFNMKGQYYLGFEHDSKSYKRFIRSGGSRNNSILVRLEPDSVFPAQYTERISRKYKRVFSPGGIGTIQKRDNLINHPYILCLMPTTPTGYEPNLQEWIVSNVNQGNFTLGHWRQRKGLICMVNGNKVSPKNNSNYWLRRKVAKELGSEMLDVYGPLWNTSIFVKIYHRLGVVVFALKNFTVPNIFSIYGNLLMRFPNAKGPIVNKPLTLQSYKYSVVIENSQTAITEKIFDCLISGVIPIYVGPDLAEYALPEDLAFVTNGCASDIRRIISTTDEEEIEKKLNAIQAFIQGKHFYDNWHASVVFKGVAQEIIDFIKETEKTQEPHQ